MKEYRRPVKSTWWLAKAAYTRFMVREFTAFFIGGYAIFLLVLLFRAARGEEALLVFLEGLRSPVAVGLHLITLVMALYHTVTWFHSTPKILVLWRGEKRVDPGLIIGAQYGLWILLSLLVGAIVLAAGRG
jgi:fumarate reductase subunit C